MKNIIESAKREMDLVNFDPAEREVMLEIMELFFQTWGNNGAVSWALPMLIRLLVCFPLTSLTGKEDEWVVHDWDGDLYAQNKRCRAVWRRRDGTSHTLAHAGNHVNIQFPYFPPLELPK
jgi:hypothetical protein